MEDVDRKLQEEMAKHEEVVAEREARIARLWWIDLFLCLGLYAAFVLFYIAFSEYPMDDIVHQEIKNYSYEHSLFDLFVVMSLRFICSMMEIATLSTDDNRSRFLTAVSYWASFLALVLSVVKAILVESPSWASVICLLIACVGGAAQLTVTQLMSPLESRDAWDPYESDEQAQAQRRRAQHEKLTQLANETATTLSGEELQQHLARERERVRTFDYLEKQAARARLSMKSGDGIRMRELLILLRPYFNPSGVGAKLIVMATWVALILSKASSIIAPLYIGKAADALVTDKRVPWEFIALYTGLQFASQACKQTQSAIYLKVKQQAYLQLAVTCFEHVHSLGLRWHTNKKMGGVMRVMSRGISAADTVVNYLFLYLLPSIAECAIVFWVFYSRFDVPLLSAIVLVHLVIYVTITVQITIWRKQYRRATNKMDNEMGDRATESLINFETIKIFGTEKYESKRYADTVREYQRFSTSTQISLSLLNSLQSLTIQSCLLCSLCTTGWHVIHGDMTIGDFSAVMAYVANIYAPLSFLGSIYDMCLQSFIDMKQLCELIAQQPEIRDAPAAKTLVKASSTSGARIEFKDVSFAYPGQSSDRALRNVSFTVEPGTTTAVVGSTGSGKSTLAKLLLRFYDIAGGAVCVDGQDVRHVTQASLRAAVGVVPQDCTLFNDTLEGNVKYGCEHATRAQVESACRDAQILDFILGLPGQWETRVGERGLRLSGGERQRIAIARCILRRPTIVVLDEATSALDSVKEREIQDALRRLERGRTSLVIAHRLSTVMHAEQIVVLESGAVVEKGTHAELHEKQGRYAALWNQQAMQVPISDSTAEVEE